MNLTPREKDKLLIFTAALLAERRNPALANGIAHEVGSLAVGQWANGQMGQ